MHKWDIHFFQEIGNVEKKDYRKQSPSVRNRLLHCDEGSSSGTEENLHTLCIKRREKRRKKREYTLAVQ